MKGGRGTGSEEETPKMTDRSLPAGFVRSARELGNTPFLYYKDQGEWRSVSWAYVDTVVTHIALGLMRLGVAKGDRICPLSETRPEMVYFCLAIATSGAIFAPIYHTNSPKECAHVINNTGGRIAYAEDQVQLDKLKAVWPECPTLERIIVLTATKAEDDPRILTVDQLVKIGKEELQAKGERAFHERVESIDPEDLTAIIHTSGTTGPPKGVMLTNRGMIKNLEILTELFPVSHRSRGISVLPMAHQLELMNGHWYHVLYGFPQYYAESIRTLYEDVRAAKPTFFFTTPRFYEKIYNEMMAYVESLPAWRKRLVARCLAIGERYQDVRYRPGKGIGYAWLRCLNRFAHLLFFRKVHAKVGGEMEWSSTGSAPIPAKILLFFRACDFLIYEGYGLTESAGTVSMNEPGAVKVGTVGKPSRGLELKFGEDGEILVRGWARCAGYWNNAAATEELFADGWLHTGDIGFLDEDGFLHINGRKKEIIITSTGKNITPSNIEILLKTSPYISEAVVFGEGRTYLAALVTLNEEQVSLFAKEQGIAFTTFEELSQHPSVRAILEKEIATRNEQLARIEQVKAFTILERQFRQDLDEVGPTMKVKRKVVETRHGDKIAAMYAQ